jgi:hypothetical protein
MNPDLTASPKEEAHRYIRYETVGPYYEPISPTQKLLLEEAIDRGYLVVPAPDDDLIDVWEFIAREYLNNPFIWLSPNEQGDRPWEVWSMVEDGLHDHDSPLYWSPAQMDAIREHFHGLRRQYEPEVPLDSGLAKLSRSKLQASFSSQAAAEEMAHFLLKLRTSNETEAAIQDRPRSMSEHIHASDSGGTESSRAETQDDPQVALGAIVDQAADPAGATGGSEDLPADQGDEPAGSDTEASDTASLELKPPHREEPRTEYRRPEAPATEHTESDS